MRTRTELMPPPTGSAEFSPAVVVSLPFETAMTPQSELERRLGALIGRVTGLLHERYSLHEYLPVVLRLRHLLQRVNFGSWKKSLVLFASPVAEKAYYLDLTLPEKISIDEGLTLKDLVKASAGADPQQFLIFLLAGERSRTYIGRPGAKPELIKTNSRMPVDCPIPYAAGIPADAARQAGDVRSRFLARMDHEFGQLLTAYPLPVFVLGDRATLAEFRRLTEHAENVVQFLEGSFFELGESALLQKIDAQVADWDGLRDLALRRQLRAARKKGTLVSGLPAILETIRHRRPKRLLIAKSFAAPLPGDDADGEAIHFYIRDVADRLIALTWEAGGKADIVEDRLLEAEDGIALVPES